MHITVTPKGPTFDRLISDTTKALRTANRAAGKEIGKAGRVAMVKGAPRFAGRILRVKPKVDARPDGASVEFTPAKGSAGAWSIMESGTKPHSIVPKARKALKFGGRFAENARHPGSSGQQAWTKAGKRLAVAVDREIVDVYDKALS